MPFFRNYRVITVERSVCPIKHRRYVVWSHVLLIAHGGSPRQIGLRQGPGMVQDPMEDLLELKLKPGLVAESATGQRVQPKTAMRYSILPNPVDPPLAGGSWCWVCCIGYIEGRGP